MNIKPLHVDFKLPVRSTEGAGAFDLYMPEGGQYFKGIEQITHRLGFAAEVPFGYVALILPRSSVGFKRQVELNNTCGVIDSDYRGEWFARIRTKDDSFFQWDSGDRLLQMMIVPVLCPELRIVTHLSETDRGDKGLGSTGV